ncbi:uncharacterized protein LACBIDRAFT_334157 [Laccaria bicolor S238N-H82]|uniref:Predicted protein n=1 Tax=Laccaria bicolor (strain S238N-H82 / ATCC MYA-4686) TaxID=486041 RepID=B0DY96_LACBS|nr:uncharacterized protein LACBIDRAFT_334157 [Laccaria bicolor S238N-H82]EDR00351.1 predicted protein [Laccaria bicolor S238N-H82]|eukprot:XP_001888910.1 predicted protein [Laccaria bicolor S238N-H82]
MGGSGINTHKPDQDQKRPRLQSFSVFGPVLVQTGYNQFKTGFSAKYAITFAILLNECKNCPKAKVIVVHDSNWCSAIQDSDIDWTSTAQDLPRRIQEAFYDVEKDNGTVYLEEKARLSQDLITSSGVSVRAEVEDQSLLQRRKSRRSQLIHPFETSPSDVEIDSARSPKKTVNGDIKSHTCRGSGKLETFGGKACNASHRSKLQCEGTAPCTNCFYASKKCTFTDGADPPVLTRPLHKPESASPSNNPSQPSQLSSARERLLFSLPYQRPNRNLPIPPSLSQPDHGDHHNDAERKRKGPVRGRLGSSAAPESFTQPHKTNFPPVTSIWDDRNPLSPLAVVIALITHIIVSNPMP